MSIKPPIKAFIPFSVVTVKATVEQLEKYASRDPSGSTWGTLGLVEPIKDEGLWLSLDGGIKVAMVQFNERILPGTVRDEKLKVAVQALQDREGRGITKKEFAQLRDEVEFELLPKAFIRRSRVPVVFTKVKAGEDKLTCMLIGTSSQKKADDVLLLMSLIFDTSLSPVALQINGSMVDKLTALSRDGSADDGSDEPDAFFATTDSATLKREAKKTIRVKDKDISDGDVQTLIRSGFDIYEVGMSWGAEADTAPTLTFTLNDKMVFKRVVMPGIKATKDSPLDYHATIMLYVQSIRQMVGDLIVSFGGKKLRPDEENGDDL